MHTKMNSYHDDAPSFHGKIEKLSQIKRIIEDREALLCTKPLYPSPPRDRKLSSISSFVTRREQRNKQYIQQHSKQAAAEFFCLLIGIIILIFIFFRLFIFFEYNHLDYI